MNQQSELFINDKFLEHNFLINKMTESIDKIHIQAQEKLLEKMKTIFTHWKEYFIEHTKINYQIRKENHSFLRDKEPGWLEEQERKLLLLKGKFNMK